MKKYYLIFLLPLILRGQEMNDFSGTVNVYYASRISDGSIINLPYRIAELKWQRQDNALSLYSHLAMEYRVPIDANFREIINPQNLSWDLRELYLTWRLINGEIRIGKQIHSWGSVDGNSPVDNLNAYDNYYLFESGAEQKIGSISMACDYYYEDWKFGFSISPNHHTNRLPINDPEFPIDLSISPAASQIIAVKKQRQALELGAFMIRSFSKGDVTLSYFDGYDRVFSSSGFNVWDNDFHNHPNGPVIDTVFSYRKTQVIGMGTVLFLGDLTLRTDFAYFTTKDIDNNLLERKYGGTVLTEYQQTNPHQYTTIRRSEEFNINAEYYQANIQFEFELPLDFQIAGQYIQYDTLKYFDDIGLVKPSEFGVVHIDEYYAAEFFFPGLGTNMAILTKSALLLDVTKTFSDNRMKWSLKTMMDQTHSGKLIEIGLDYDINESLKSYLAVTKVFGDDAQDDKYSFNHMEDFSHIRMELKYYY